MIEFHRELETDTVKNPMIISCTHTIPLSNIKDIKQFTFVIFIQTSDIYQLHLC